MSKVITINAVAGKIKLTNTYVATAEENLALAQLQTIKDNELWNTGDAMVGDPHINEVANAGKTFITDPNGWAAKHIAAIPMYRNNGYAYLLPGDELVIETKSGAETLHYLTLNDPLLSVEAVDTEVTPGVEPGAADHPVEGKTFVEGDFYGRTTGVGDFDDGEADNGEYPFQFNTAEATAEAAGLEIVVAPKTEGITLTGNALSGALAAAATDVVLTITADGAEVTAADATVSGDDFTFAVFEAGGNRALTTADVVATKDGVSTTKTLDFSGVTYTAG